MLQPHGVPALRARVLSDAEAKLAAVDAAFKALAHPQRRQILLVLKFRGGELTAGEIADRFACSWPTTSRHLKQLEEAGLVSVTRRGRERVYALSEAGIGAAKEWLAHL